MTEEPYSLLTLEEFRLFRELVEELSGIVVDDAKRESLGARVQRRMKELRLAAAMDYYYHLKFSPTAAEERVSFIASLTNNETYFFREKPQLDALTAILPAIRDAKIACGVRKLRIVSAGCSTGEEVYSIIMVLIESGLFLWDWDVSVIGFDIDPHALSRAREGVYGPRSLQATSPEIASRYFSETPAGMAVREVVRRQAAFRQGNLLEEPERLVGNGVDIIFCRNVFIYFREATMRSVVARFSDILAPEGWLFLGHSESLSRVSDDFVPRRFPGTIIYRKK